MKFWVLDKESGLPLHFESISAVTDYVTKTLGVTVALRRKIDRGYIFSAGDFYLVVHEED